MSKKKLKKNEKKIQENIQKKSDCEKNIGYLKIWEALLRRPISSMRKSLIFFLFAVICPPFF